MDGYLIIFFYPCAIRKKIICLFGSIVLITINIDNNVQPEMKKTKPKGNLKEFLQS